MIRMLARLELRIQLWCHWCHTRDQMLGSPFCHVSHAALVHSDYFICDHVMLQMSDVKCPST
eukprot:4924885-Amphidinium_carterae.1